MIMQRNELHQRTEIIPIFLSYIEGTLYPLQSIVYVKDPFWRKEQEEFENSKSCFV